MSYRIRQRDLEQLVKNINGLHDTPPEPWVRNDDGKLTGQVGNYHLSYAYGGVCLHKMLSKGGAVADVFGCGHIPKRDLYNRMQARLDGIRAATQFENRREGAESDAHAAAYHGLTGE